MPCLQLLILVPEMDHPAYGTVRVMVKDSNDPSGERSLVYLDSDGRVNSDGNRTADRPESFVGEPQEGSRCFVSTGSRQLEGSQYWQYVSFHA